jgi:arylsulfatase A-like enzyme
VIFFFNDHGQNAKGTLYQGGVHSPSIVWRKGGFPCGDRLSTLLSNVDFAPTILDLAGVEHPEEGLDGRSFLPYLMGETVPGDRALYFELGYTRAVRQGPWKYLAVRYPEPVALMSPEKRAEALASWNAKRRRRHLPIVTTDPTRPFSHLTPIPGGGHAEVESTGRYPGYYDRDQLYDLSRDPREQHNLADDPAYAPQLRALKAALARQLSGLPGSFALQSGPASMAVSAGPRRHGSDL